MLGPGCPTLTNLIQLLPSSPALPSASPFRYALRELPVASAQRLKPLRATISAAVEYACVRIAWSSIGPRAMVHFSYIRTIARVTVTQDYHAISVFYRGIVR